MDVVVNAATSVDGKLSTRRREQLPISGPEDFDRVDRLRAAADAIAVGVGTVLADDPNLGVKEEQRRVTRLQNGRPAHPARVVVDTRARTPPDAELFDGEATVYVLVGEGAPGDRLEALRGAGATVLVAGTDDGRVDLPTAFEALSAEGIDRLMVEGGGELVYSLFEAGLVDELSVYVGSFVIGGRNAPTLADGDGFIEAFPELDLVGVDRLDDGVLLSYEVGEIFPRE
ncbi:Pyrimidine reductase, riboflavin biosynthesis [Halalkaliarchaeum sp. AArc-CO]|uniref:2,5-diamino-6-(ribosylamino)-4(3H)-pyrimidinone 5'-phosphate reductase n=1 Tax=unclassified Halalkaliarchaeum TaxID=2678344 RepID=UPI00217E70BD|nr:MULTISPECIES: 2,5-diamino-6-(ribosylamino)-4(3H)-pyrimidinone 5'-phosphate reductase [unclassified Halalkaliarchaeum]MDR5674141.1 2,5-diamino-6-(ribosylamino)-4(3H)-pyrimidinone 5'-phosphate reductase [Halalkaliarchaeum sp. AArc-GB]UWG50862.1 Pyrimidine reductase, riboflavin biosynthesis [Halalkaliarchaeum sp. AArc-CO]